MLENGHPSRRDESRGELKLKQARPSGVYRRINQTEVYDAQERA
jgi:hypothetical protein